MHIIVSNFYSLLVLLTGFNSLDQSSLFYDTCQKFCLWGSYILFALSFFFVFWLIYKSFMWLYHLFF